MKELLPEPNEFSKKADNNKKWVDYVTIYTKAPCNYIKDREAILANYKAFKEPEQKIKFIFLLNVWALIYVYTISLSTIKV